MKHFCFPIIVGNPGKAVVTMDFRLTQFDNIRKPRVIDTDYCEKFDIRFENCTWQCCQSGQKTPTRRTWTESAPSSRVECGQWRLLRILLGLKRMAPLAFSSSALQFSSSSSSSFTSSSYGRVY